MSVCLSRFVGDCYFLSKPSVSFHHSTPCRHSPFDCWLATDIGKAFQPSVGSGFIPHCKVGPACNVLALAANREQHPEQKN